LHHQPPPGRLRPVVLLPDAGVRAVPEPPATLAPPGRGGDGVLARRRHSDGDHRGGAGQPMVGQRGEDLRAARAVDAVVLGRAAHDPLLLRLPRLAPLVRVGHPAPPRDAGHRAGLGLRGRPYAADALVDAGGPRLGVRQAGAAERAAGGARHFQARLQERADPGAHAGRDQPRHHGQRAVVVETVFAWPGVGRLLYEGIAFRDFPVVQATVLLGGAMIVIVNLLVDIMYAVIDPRNRYAG